MEISDRAKAIEHGRYTKQNSYVAKINIVTIFSWGCFKTEELSESLYVERAEHCAAGAMKVLLNSATTKGRKFRTKNMHFFFEGREVSDITEPNATGLGYVDTVKIDATVRQVCQSHIDRLVQMAKCLIVCTKNMASLFESRDSHFCDRKRHSHLHGISTWF